MRIPRVLQDGDYQPGEQVNLEKRASQHLIKVLRYREGDAIILFNGKGKSFNATIAHATADSTSVTVGEDAGENTESSLRLHLVMALSKGDRMDYAIQKAVEAGVNQITPVISQHSVVRLDEKRKKSRLQHWQGIVVHACEQSGRTHLAQINPVLNLNKAIASLSAATRLILDPLASRTLHDIQASNDVILLVGPEGGFDQSEVSMATGAGYETIKLGPRVFRTETACVAACVALQTLWGDLA